MRILSLYVENFGVLQQFSLTPEEGLHTLLRPNGWGKSSLAVFIKAMLYGLPVSSRRSLIENERKRYTPWQGGVYGGTMDVLVGERQLRIERTFGAKESDDTLVLTDLQSGVQLPVEAISPGEMWFGIDAAAYERSTYVSQRPIDESDGNLSIHAKLNRLVDAGDDLGCFDRALEILEKQRKYYAVSGGRRGAIADDEEQLAQLNAQIEACHVHRQAALDCEARLEALGEQQAALREKEQQLLAKEQTLLRANEREAKWQNLRQLQALADAEQTNYTQIVQSLGGRLPNEEQLQALDQMEQEMTALRAQRAALEGRLDVRHALRQEEAALAALFASGTPDEASLVQLRQEATRAHSAQLRLQSAQRESAVNDDEQTAAPSAQTLDELRQLQRFFIQYPTAEQRILHQCKLGEEACDRAAQQVQATLHAQARSKRAFWITLAAGLVLSAVLLAIYPILAVLPVLATVVIEILLLRGRKAASARSAQAKAELEACRATREELKREQAHLQAQWAAACRRFEKLLGVGVTDAMQAQEALAEYQTHLAQAQARRAARVADDQARADRLQQALAQAEACIRGLAALWRWGEIPDAADAPVAVERLAQRAARYRQLQAEVATAQQQMAQLDAQLQSLAERRGALLEGCEQIPDSGVVVWMRERIRGAEQCLHARQEYLARAQSYAQENGLQAPEPTDGAALALPSQEQITQERTALQVESEALYSEVARLRREMEAHTAHNAVLDALENEAAELRARLQASRESLYTVQETQKYLKQAKEQLSGRYLTKMKQSFSQYLAAITDEETPSFTMDGNFAVKLRRMGVSRSREAFSTGWRDIIALCARLALVDALFEDETPFLVLDDPFANLDDDTAARAKALLRVAAERYQILYLTCHSSRV